MKKLNVFLILLTLVVFNSCKKGDDGAQGPPGTANVIYSNWLDVTYEAVTDQNTGDTLAWEAEIAVPKLSDTILNKGTVKVYLNISNNPVADPFITPLPLADFSLLGLFITPYFAKQSITLISTGDASSFTQNNVKYFQYRYVIIPGGAPARMPTIDWNNYAEVKKYLNLKD